VHAVGDTEVGGQPRQRRAFGAVPHEGDVDVRQLAGRVQQHPEVLDRGQAPDRPDERDPGGDADGTAELPGAGPRGIERVEVERDRQDVPPRLVPDPDAEQLVADLGAHRHERVGPAGQAALGLDHRPADGGGK
jgi:hypothetical protein